MCSLVVDFTARKLAEDFLLPSDKGKPQASCA
jgi:hypothetical protein